MSNFNRRGLADSWIRNCLGMGMSEQHRPERTHRDGYEGLVPTTQAGIENLRREFELALARNQWRSKA